MCTYSTTINVKAQYQFIEVKKKKSGKYCDS